ncbi:MAG: type II toxin-antitoxin system Phd/YefM family antitoxin [Microbacterium sp.]
MSTISHREMRNNSADVLRRVEAGETFVITNHGRPVAQIEPVKNSVIEDLTGRGQIRPALHGPEALRGLVRAKLPDGVTSADIIADVRGYDRGY